MRKWMQLSPVALVALTGFTMLSTQGCNEVAEQCGLTCPVEGIAQGNASISGVASVDAFFGAVVNFTAKANLVSSGIELRLARIRASLGLDADATPAEIVAEIEAQYELSGGITIAYQPPQCGISAQATIEATARCDVEFEPGSATVQCSGSCEVDASVQGGGCEGEAEVVCVGTAPGLECEGTCEGTCQLDAAATCAGTCNGACDGECSVMNGDSCAGQCDGECAGSCELTAGGECAGECRGQCTYTPPSGECMASATVRCEPPTANATVECNGRCDGEITPPSASAECEASAKAEASVNVECTPPSIDVQYGFAADASVETRAEFQAFLVGFRANMAAIVTELRRADIVLEAGGQLRTAATAAVHESVSAAAEGDLDLKTTAGLRCAVAELGNVSSALNGATTQLTAKVSVAADLTAELAN